MKSNVIKKNFPISSQTSSNDKKIILKIINFLKKNKKKRLNILKSGFF